MKKLLTIGLLTSLLFITGCSKESESYTKFMDEGKLALASEEYDKAMNLFNLAISEKGGKDAESESLIYQIQVYENLQQLAADMDSKGSGYIKYLIEGCNEILAKKSNTTLIQDKVTVLKAQYVDLLYVSQEAEKYIEERIAYFVKLVEEEQYDELDKIYNSFYFEIMDSQVDYLNYQQILTDISDVKYELRRIKEFNSGKIWDVIGIVNKGTVEWSPEFIERVHAIAEAEENSY